MNEVYQFLAYGVPVPLQSVKFRIVTGKDGKSFAQTYKPKKVLDWQDSVRQQAKCDRPPVKPLDGMVEVYIDAYMPIPTSWTKKKKAQAVKGEVRPVSRPDCDNIGKPILDAIEGLYFTNDSRIVTYRVRKYYAIDPRVHVRVVSDRF